MAAWLTACICCILSLQAGLAAAEAEPPTDEERNYWEAGRLTPQRYELPPPDYLSADFKGAQAFCASPEYSSLQCGFAGDQEWQQTLATQCPTCDTLNEAFPAQLPAVLRSNRTAPSVTASDADAGSSNNTDNTDWPVWYTSVISLACSGQLLVRSVFQILEQPGVQGLPHLTGVLPLSYKNCTSARLSELPEAHLRNTQAQVVRCELQVPDGPEPEEQRAVRAKEGRCWICTWCDKQPSETVSLAGCPSNLGQWYSDSYTTVATGCNITNPANVVNGYAQYLGHRVELVVRPKTQILLADLTVCSDPGCYDAVREEAKLQSARRCLNGVCN